MLEHHLSPRTTRVLNPQCIALAPDDIESLRDRVGAYCPKIRCALAYNEFLDIETVECIGNVLGCLFDEYNSFTKAQQALIVGATRYFLQANDVEPDTTSILGSGDDTAVLETVGRNDPTVAI